jgi:hypothetical protein
MYPKVGSIPKDNEAIRSKVNVPYGMSRSWAQVTPLAVQLTTP